MKVNVVLVGSNPLPCYVVSDYLKRADRSDEELIYLPKPDIFLFVYSNKTEEYFKRIREKLALKNNEIEECNLLENQASASEIEKRVSESLNLIENKHEKIDYININNTGGTKPMAVYATDAVRKFVEKKGSIKEIESYLDPVSNKIKINSICGSYKKEIDDNKSLPKGKDLRYYFGNLDLGDVIEIHNMGRDEHPKCQKDEYKVKNDIIDFGKKILNDFWDKYYEFAEFIFFNTQNYEHKNNDVIKTLLNDKNEVQIYTFDKRNSNDGIREGIKCYNLNSSVKLNWLSDLIGKNILEFTGKDLNKFIDFITGKWLEQYMYEAVNKAIDMIKKEDKDIPFKVYWSYEVKEDKIDRPFEIDLIVLKGYQSIIFSVTIGDDIGLTKMKAFEALHRADQLGGEHSKVILVNLLDNEKCKKLRKDLTGFNAEVYKDTKIIDREIASNFDELVTKIAYYLK